MRGNIQSMRLHCALEMMSVGVKRAREWLVMRALCSFRPWTEEGLGARKLRGEWHNEILFRGR